MFVCDLNIPWFCNLVTSRKFPLSALQWDKTGSFLFVSDTNGLAEVFTSKDNLINEWVSVCKVSLVGENIIRASFFHNGVKFQYNQDKKDQVIYSEKYQRQKFAPSVRKFGRVSEFGCLLITSTGLVASFLIPQIEEPSTTQKNELGNVDVVMESLGLTRNYYQTADISFTNDGHFLVAVSSCNNKTWKSNIIHCFKISVEKTNNTLAITSRALSSFFPCEGALRDCSKVEIIKLKWSSEEDPESLMVLANHGEGSCLEVWQQNEEIVPIHKLLQTNKNTSFKTNVWKNKAVYKNAAKAINLITSKLGFGTNLLSNVIFIALQDNSINCLHKEGSVLKRLAGVSFKGGYTYRSNNDIENIGKHSRISSRVLSFDSTHFGHLLIILDSIGQISCYKCNFIINDILEIPQNSVTASVNLLEFCLISGLDTYDLMLALKPQLLDNIIDKLTENFNRQPTFFVQYYYVKFLTMKINLQRLSTSGQSKANDLMCLLNLHSILTAFKSLLRPSDLISREKGPAENLSMILSESVPDVDKVLLNLEAKDFTVEPSTLQSLQQLIQWVADLALNILAKLPEVRTFLNINKTTGDLSDIMALSSIRELLVIIRIWGLLKPSCLPVFSRSTDNLDVLSILFKLLTKLGLNPNEPDEILLDECCLLPSQVLVPQLQMNASRTSVLSSAFSHSSYPFHFEYNVENELVKFTPDIEGSMLNNTVVDSIRHIQLGCNQKIRKCTRCGAHSSLHNIGRTVAMKSWENRYIGCKCGGGYWQEVKS